MCRALIWCICCVFPYREHRDECQAARAGLLLLLLVMVLVLVLAFGNGDNPK